MNYVPAPEGRWHLPLMLAAPRLYWQARRGTACCALAAFLWVGPHVPAMAATITAGPANTGCTLTDAINSAGANTAISGCVAGEASPVVDRIIFDPSLSGQTIIGTTAYRISSDMEIDGASLITLSREGPSHRIFEIGSGATVILRGLNLKNGQVDGSSNYGGAIENLGDLTLDTCVVSDSSATADGGAIANYSSLTLLNTTMEGNTSGIWGGAIINWAGDLTIENSWFSNNTSTGDGGGISLFDGSATIRNSYFTGNSSGNFGGGLRNNATMTIENTTFTGNSANTGGGISNAGTLDLDSSTVSRNTSSGSGGGIFTGGSMTITRSTISGNTAGSFGAGIVSGAISIFESTIVGNASGFAGFFSGLSSSSRFGTLVNTVIADNTADGAPADCSSLRDWTRRSNWSGDGSCGVATGFSGAPGLGPLADNGGPTLTHLPLAESGLLDTANFSDCSVSDQRGVTRPQDPVGGSETDCDIGSVERLSAPSSLCVIEDAIVLPDMIDGSDQEFESEGQLFTAGAVTVNSDASLSLSAAEAIGLGTGLTVQTGATLALFIAPTNCN